MVNSRLCSRLLLVGMLVIGTLLTPCPGSAHPMGNFSINHFSALEVHPALVRITYILDLAEVPTFQEMQNHGLITQPDAPDVAAYRERKAQEL